MRNFFISAILVLVMGFTMSCSNVSSNKEANEEYNFIIERMTSTYDSYDMKKMQRVIEAAEQFEEKYAKDLSSEQLNNFRNQKDNYKERYLFQSKLIELLETGDNEQ